MKFMHITFLGGMHPVKQGENFSFQLLNYMHDAWSLFFCGINTNTYNTFQANSRLLRGSIISWPIFQQPRVQISLILLGFLVQKFHHRILGRDIEGPIIHESTETNVRRVFITFVFLF